MAGYWSAGVPDQTDDAVLKPAAASYGVSLNSAGAVVRSLTIGAGATLALAGGSASLGIAGGTFNSGAVAMTGAYLQLGGDFINVGAIRGDTGDGVAAEIAGGGTISNERLITGPALLIHNLVTDHTEGVIRVAGGSVVPVGATTNAGLIEAINGGGVITAGFNSTGSVTSLTSAHKPLAPDLTSPATPIRMEDVLDIGDVARETGLTLRALRFYEARGLVAPLRTAGGRRVYGAGELARLTAVTALKQAGFSLSRIADLLGGRTPELGRIVAAQLAAVEAEAAALADTRRLLLQVQSRIDRGEPIDVATLCSLIRHGDTIMHNEQWNEVVDQYFSPAAQREFKEKMADVPGGFDQAAYSARWRELGSRIEATLPLDPASEQAQAFVDEWFALLKPFSQVATPAMRQGTAKMYGDMPNWKASPDMGFGHEVWQLIQAATTARRAAGGTVDGAAWMTGAAK